MKPKTLLFLLTLGVLAAAFGVSKIHSTNFDLVACCDPATDPDCGVSEDDDGGNISDSMPAEILG